MIRNGHVRHRPGHHADNLVAHEPQVYRQLKIPALFRNRISSVVKVFAGHVSPPFQDPETAFKDKSGGIRRKRAQLGFVVSDYSIPVRMFADIGDNFFHFEMRSGMQGFQFVAGHKVLLPDKAGGLYGNRVHIRVKRPQGHEFLVRPERAAGGHGLPPAPIRIEIPAVSLVIFHQRTLEHACAVKDS